MSLIKTFPEVELFFSSDKFSHVELLSFIEEVEKKYTDKKLRASIASLISLKILQYQIYHEEESKNNNSLAKQINIHLKHNDKNEIHPYLHVLKHNSIENIAINLHWSSSRLIRLLEQKGIFKKPQSLLDDTEFKQVSEMLNTRLKGIDRIEKTKKPKAMIKKDKPKSLGHQIQVYTKIKAIGIGKVIYIRKK
jgi:hypothetical protein